MLAKHCGTIVICLLVVALSTAEGINGSDDHLVRTEAPSACCGSVLGGMCADGTRGTPCCGVGSCNAFCCGCSHGCRTAPSPAPPLPPIPPSASSTPLNQWPMLTTHDAGTSYYSRQTCTLDTDVSNYVVTQVPGTFTHQLDCGARAFDLRPHQAGSKLVMHHGGFTINHAVIDVLTEIVKWAGENPNELVLIYGSHCSGGSACMQKFFDALASANITRIDCSEIASLTLGTAFQRGKLPQGGSVLASWGCVEEHYNASIGCYGDLIENNTELPGAASRIYKFGEGRSAQVPGPYEGRVPRSFMRSCYGSHAEQAFDPLWGYMTRTCDGHGKSQGNLWMAQAHWQTDASTIAQGELRLSCILSDESKAGVNRKLAGKISEGLFPHINLLEVDNICGGHGPELLRVLRGRFTYDVDALSKRSSTVII